MQRAEHHHLLPGPDVLRRFPLARIHGDIPALVAKRFSDRLQCLTRGMEEMHRLCEQVVHPWVELGGAPYGEIEQGKGFLDLPHEFCTRVQIQLHRHRQPRIPAAAGVVDEALFDGLTEVNRQ